MLAGPEFVNSKLKIMILDTLIVILDTPNLDFRTPLILILDTPDFDLGHPLILTLDNP